MPKIPKVPVTALRQLEDQVKKNPTSMVLRTAQTLLVTLDSTGVNGPEAQQAAEELLPKLRQQANEAIESSFDQIG